MSCCRTAQSSRSTLLTRLLPTFAPPGKRDAISLSVDGGGRLHWWRFLRSWLDPEEPVAPEILKRCELVEIRFKGLYLAVRGKVNPDNWTVEAGGIVFRVDPEWTVEVDGEILHLLVNDSFGLTRGDLIKLFPELAPKKHPRDKVIETIALMKELYPPHGLPPSGAKGREGPVKRATRHLEPVFRPQNPKNAMESALLRFRRCPSLCGGSI
jgi:hypothetical protein